jgi:hypothetical protein
METPGSTILTALGGSGSIDYPGLATDVADASFAFQRDTVQARRDRLEAQVSAASQLRAAVTDLASALGDRVRNGDLAPRGTLGNAAVARVSVPLGLSPRGTFSLEVTQLAKSQTLVTKSYASGAALVGAGTLGIRFGTVAGAGFTEDTASTALAIAVTATDTLATLATKITTQSGGAISAYVAQGTTGAQLVLKGAEGAAKGFVLEPVEASGSADLTRICLEEAVAALGTALVLLDRSQTVPREPLARAQSIIVWLAQSVAPAHPLYATLKQFYGGMANQIGSNLQRADPRIIARGRADLADVLAAAG